MCLLAVFYRVVEDAPLVIGANREEFYTRGGLPPGVLLAQAAGRQARAVAGTDPVAGGTWLGVNEHGLLVAVTNRAISNVPQRPRSRGLLARDLLAFESARDAAEHATAELQRGLYAGCNFLCADASAAIIIQAGDWLRVRPLPPGLHALTNGDINDEHDPRLAHVLGQLGGRSYPNAEACLSALRRICAQHPPEGPPICLHGADRGTVSSTLIALRNPLAASMLLHAQGPPDRVSYVDCSGLLREALGDAPHVPAPNPTPRPLDV